MSPEVVIRGGTVVDGTGAEPRASDVLIADGRVVAVGDVPEVDAQIVDSTGLFVTPGFIDIHSHSDFTLLVDPRAVSAIHQGVTTEVVGNCGHGCFPVHDPGLARLAIYGYDESVSLVCRGAGEYLERLDAARPAVNVATLVPNGQLRLSTVGLADRPANADERTLMAARLREALAEGAWGYSTGLEYAQEAGATEDEIASLVAIAADAGALYATHTRRRDDGSATAVAEAVRTARRAGGRLQVSHLVPRSGPEETARCTQVVDAADADGLDIAFDMHTRTFGLTHLFAALPGGALGAPRSELAAFLRDPARREDVRRHRSILSAGGDWRRVVLLDNPFWPECSRRDIAAIAQERRSDPIDVVCDLLLGALDDPHQLMVIIHAYTCEQQRAAFSHPLCIPGSDATTLAPDGPLAGCSFHGAYTWASWFFHFAVREHALLTAAEAVHRLTGRPAERLGLRDRGVLRPGAHADIAVFDPASFTETGTTFEPNQLATGMRHVFVNGVHTLANGELTGQRGGMALRR